VRSSPKPILCTALTLSLLALAPARAQTAPEPAQPTAAAHGGLGADIKAYVTAPLHWRGKDWARFGGALAAISAAYQYDDKARTHFLPADQTGLTDTDTRDLHDAIPAALALGGTWLSAALIDDDDGRLEARSMLEAAALSSTAAYILKQAAGRERPYETADRASWHRGGDAFPSLHVTAAFAIGTVLAESGNDRYRWIRRVLGYTIAAGTAYERLDHQAHWASDAMAGALLGVASARFVMSRRNADERRAESMLVPLRGGVMLTYTVPLSR
jgi:membrane-associated phospholipid phosphatase